MEVLQYCMGEDRAVREAVKKMLTAHYLLSANNLSSDALCLYFDWIGLKSND